MASPFSASHSRTVLSDDPDTIFLPSGAKATVVTPPLWPSKTHNDLLQRKEVEVTLGSCVQLEYNLYIRDSFGLIGIPER
jgi:hypothetical protein